MFFAKLSRIIAYLLLVAGSLRLLLGVIGASSVDHQAFARRYLGTTTTGEAIDGSLKLIAIGIVFGIFWEVCNLLKHKST